jgi:hypothetical protein
MGGKGSGGRRVGSGKKRKSDLEHAIAGTTSARGVLLTHPSSTAIAPIEAFDPPATLRGKALRVWLELAPLAFEARTLTRSTEVSFVMLCRNVALERKMAATRGAGGANHRGMIQRVDAEMAKFCLSPFGKPMYDAAKPATSTNPLDRFTKARA